MIATILIYIVWEVAPLVLLLATIATGPRSSASATSTVVDQTLLSYGVFGAINEGSAKHERRRLRRDASAHSGTVCLCCCRSGWQGGDDDTSTVGGGDGDLNDGWAEDDKVSAFLATGSTESLDRSRANDGNTYDESARVPLDAAEVSMWRPGIQDGGDDLTPSLELHAPLASAASTVAFLRSASAAAVSSGSAPVQGSSTGSGLGVSGGLLLTGLPPGLLQQQVSQRSLLRPNGGSSSSSGGSGLGLGGRGGSAAAGGAQEGIASSSGRLPPRPGPVVAWGSGAPHHLTRDPSLRGAVNSSRASAWTIGEEDEDDAEADTSVEVRKPPQQQRQWAAGGAGAGNSSRLLGVGGAGMGFGLQQAQQGGGRGAGGGPGGGFGLARLGQGGSSMTDDMHSALGDSPGFSAVGPRR